VRSEENDAWRRDWRDGSEFSQRFIHRPPSSTIHHPSLRSLLPSASTHTASHSPLTKRQSGQLLSLSCFALAFLPSCEGGGVVGGGQRHRLMFNPLITVGLSVRRVDKWQCDGCEHVLLVLVMCVKAAHKVVFSTVRIECGFTLN